MYNKKINAPAMVCDLFLYIVSDIDLVSMVAGMSVGKSDDSSSIHSDSAYGTGSIISSTYAQVSQYRQVRSSYDC